MRIVFFYSVLCPLMLTVLAPVMIPDLHHRFPNLHGCKTFVPGSCEGLSWDDSAVKILRPHGLGRKKPVATGTYQGSNPLTKQS